MKRRSILAALAGWGGLVLAKATGKVPPSVDFTFSPSGGTAPVAIQFDNLSSGAKSYRWDFGDGGTSTAANPLHSYGNGGNYTVSLSAFGTAGTSATKSKSLVVLAAAPPPPPPPAPPPPPPSGAIQTLTVFSSVGGSAPYSAAVIPMRGRVPANCTLGSVDDPSLSASILSRWDDGSASLIVVAGNVTMGAGTTKTIALGSVAAQAIPPLTTARISALVPSLSVSFGNYGTGSIGAPERVWWANAQVICARYRISAPSSPTLEAVVDIHAYAADRAKVEIVVENSKMDSAAPIKPGTAGYVATVTLNGAVVATVNAPNHEAFRAWYCCAWVGGDPMLEVTHNPAELQAHPLLFKIDQSSNQSMQTLYESDGYVPWSVGRIRAPGMGAGGDHPMIGALTLWDTHYMQTGDRFARRAVIANALAVLSLNVNYRDIGGSVPTPDQVRGKTWASGALPATTTEPAWEVSHHPAAGLMAFLCQPSPCLIEIAQKHILFSAQWSNPDGIFNKWFGTRGVAWCMRSLAHAIFLTPAGDAWKAAGVSLLQRNLTRIDSFRTSPVNPLGVHMGGDIGDYQDEENDEATPNPYGGFQGSVWMHYWLAGEMHKIANARLAGSKQAALAATADWLCRLPVRMVNESVGGEWRYHAKMTTIGQNNFNSTNGLSAYGSGTYGGANPGQLSNWGQMFAWYRGAAPTQAGPWVVGNGAYPAQPNYSSPAWGTSYLANSDLNYVEHFWAGLAYAAERGVEGSAQAWLTVNASVTNLSTWRTGFAIDPRQGVYPRNLSAMATPTDDTYASGSGATVYGGTSASYPAWRSSMLALTWKKVGGVMNDINPLNNAALNPLGAGVTGTWQNIPAAQTFDGATGASEGFPAFVDDWCGGVYNAGRLYAFGGGHNGYAGNEVLSIDITAESPQWRIERPPTGWKGSPSEGITLADGQEASRIYSNGDPRSTHSYDLIAWANDGMYIAPAAVFMAPERGNATANKIFKFTPGANPTIGTDASYGTWSAVTSGLAATNWNSGSLTYDPARNYLYCTKANLMQRFDITAGAFLSSGSIVATDADIKGIYIPGLDLVVYLNYVLSSKFWVYKPSANTAHSPGAAGTAPAPVAEPAKANTAVIAEYFTAAAWVPELGAIVCRAEGGTGFHTLTPPASGDPTTTAWTWGRLEASSANTVTPDNRNVNGDYGRFFYSPELKCIGFVSATSAAQANNPNSSGLLNIFALP